VPPFIPDIYICLVGAQTMVKQDLTNSLAKAFSGISKQDMLNVVNTLFESMEQALMRGKIIDLRGVGRFKIKQRGPAKGRNPKTKTAVYMPKRWVVHFKPAESLSKRINS
jgi:integration host factor subunit beta